MATVMDGLRSLIGRLGDPERDKSASIQFHDELVSDQQLIAAYRNNWVARKIVDIPAKDALRKWRTWAVDDPAAVAREETRLGIRVKALDALTKARIFGGAAIYIGTAQSPEKPMSVRTIGEGGIEHLTVFSRRSLVAGEIERDPLQPSYGRPAYYTLSGGEGSGGARIHPSRLIIMRADARADDWLSAGVNASWDESVLVATAEVIRQTGGTFANIASLIHEANVDVFGVPDLMQRLGDPAYESALLNRFSLAARGKSVTNSLLMDAAETYQRNSASFADLSPIMETFALFAAAAADIPATRFLARSPSGIVATGGHDMANYHDKLQGMQELEIRPAMAVFDQCLLRSAGIDDPEADYEWRPLEQMNETELAAIGKTTAETVEMLAGLGTFTQDQIREIAVHRLAENKSFPHIAEIAAETAAAMELEPMPDEPDDDPDDEPKLDVTE